jgi:glycosyltransferase involved in cell wall biosynthesis
VYVNLHSRLSRIRSAILMGLELLRLLPSVDLVHVQGYSSKNILITALSRLLRRPLVLHLQTAQHDEPAAVRAAGALAWWAFNGARLYLSVSDGLTHAFAAAGLSTDRVRQAPNGVDITRFAPADDAARAETRRALGLPDRPVVLFVGVVTPDKQPHVLFDAFARVQADAALPATLVIVGATNEQLFELGDRLADRIRVDAERTGLSDRVIFVAPTSRIEDYFRAATIFVLPSIREGMPIALLEGMSSGLPCIASLLPGATDVLIEDGRNGRLIDPGNIEGFAGAIRALLADPTAAKRLGDAARHLVEANYTMAQVADRWMTAYREVTTVS